MKTMCEECIHYQFDDEYEYYICEVNLDEDEMRRFIEGADFECPYWRSNDDYAIVRKQN